MEPGGPNAPLELDMPPSAVCIWRCTAMGSHIESCLGQPCNAAAYSVRQPSSVLNKREGAAGYSRRKHCVHC